MDLKKRGKQITSFSFLDKYQKKSIKEGKQIHACFIVMKKAFDGIRREIRSNTRTKKN